MTSSSRSRATQQSVAPAEIRLYNTLSKTKERLEPVVPGQVGIYLCGPTVYDLAHIGHMVGPVIFDCIARHLKHSGYDVQWVVNITDVDDKLIRKAGELGISMAEVAERNIADYHANLSALGVDQIDEFPRATECMEEIIEFIAALVAQGHAYASEGDVYFEVATDDDYGKLSNRSAESGQGEGGEMASRKRSAGDFALWKAAKPEEPSWQSPWGAGRPGWHIECSAMSRKLLGETFDIHGGGLDLVFPHHENEIAQSECRHAKPMVKYWLHNGLLRADSQAGKVGGRGDRKSVADAGDAADSAAGKMSRSQGAGGLADLIGRQGGERIRFFLLRTHYRSTVVFSEPAIEEAATGLETFYRLFKRYARITGRDFYAIDPPPHRAAGAVSVAGAEGLELAALQDAAGYRDKFLQAMDDDFNTGGAIAELFELARRINKYCDDAGLESGDAPSPESLDHLTQLMTILRELTSVLGLFGSPPATPAAGTSKLTGQLMQLLIALRSASRGAQDFATADKIRAALSAMGIQLEDRGGGTEWSPGQGDYADGLMDLLIDLRKAARANKDFATADQIRDALQDAGVTLEDRAAGTEWTVA